MSGAAAADRVGEMGRIGISNVGFLCFVSAAWQVLTQIIGLLDFVTFDSEDLLLTLRAFYIAKWERNQFSVVPGENIVKAINGVSVAENGTQVPVLSNPEAQYHGAEGDPNEHFRSMLDVIDKTPEGAASKRKYLEGEYEYVTQCDRCGSKTSRIEKFDQVQASFEGEESLTIESVFYNMLKPERLEGVNQFYCETCKTNTDAERRTYIHKFPNYMMIHVLRFQYPAMTKVTTPFNFEHNFHHNAPEGAAYTLVGAVVHTGGTTIRSGHYTAYGRIDVQPDEPAQWLRYNDSVVHPVGPETLTRDPVPNNVYLLLYRRVPKRLVPVRPTVKRKERLEMVTRTALAEVASKKTRMEPDASSYDTYLSGSRPTSPPPPPPYDTLPPF